MTGRHPTTPLRFVAGRPDLALVRHFVEEQAVELGLDPEAAQDLVLAANEIVTNSIVHGYHDHPGAIEIDVARAGAAVAVRIRDQAPPFDPRDVPPPDLTLPLSRRAPGGMGIHMTRHLTDGMSYHFTADGWNEITLTKRVEDTSRQEDNHADDC